MQESGVFKGDVVAKPGMVYDFTEITGNVDARKADAGAFPKLTTIGGYAYFQGWTGSAPKLTTIGGSAYFRGWTGSAPKLTTIGGYADFQGWTGSAPKLTTIGVYADFQGWTGSAPKLTTIGGSAYFRGWTGSAPKLTTIGGAADFQGWTGSAPKLTTIGGSAYFRGWTGSAPKLTTIGGSAYFQGWTGSAPKLTTIGGAADFQGWTGSAPKLTTIGGAADFRGWTKKKENIKTNDPNAAAVAQKSIFAANLKMGYYYVDGILSRLVSRKGKVARVVICDKTATYYVVEDGEGNYSHGATLKEARDGLLYKVSSRDTSEFKKWNLKTEVSLHEAIVAYRAITGACEEGTRHFCEMLGNPPQTLTVREAIKLTKGQYRSEVFSAFFGNAA